MKNFLVMLALLVGCADEYNTYIIEGVDADPATAPDAGPVVPEDGAYVTLFAPSAGVERCRLTRVATTGSTSVALGTDVVNFVNFHGTLEFTSSDSRDHACTRIGGSGFECAATTYQEEIHSTFVDYKTTQVRHLSGHWTAPGRFEAVLTIKSTCVGNPTIGTCSDVRYQDCEASQNITGFIP